MFIQNPKKFITTYRGRRFGSRCPRSSGRCSDGSAHALSGSPDEMIDSVDGALKANEMADCPNDRPKPRVHEQESSW